MFIGEYRGKIDNKGRVVIPVKLRKILFESDIYSVYITRGLENSIFVFPEKNWADQTEKLKSLPFTKGDPRVFTRLFFSGAFYSKLDKQGRISLPQTLVTYSRLKENFVIIGVGDRFEIWAEEVWEEYSKQASNSYVEIAEKLLY